jgi:hypothetical protein
MPKRPTNHREEWTTRDDRALRKLVTENTPTRLIARELGRTAGAVYQHASSIGVSLRPTNQSPYGPRRRK